MPNVITQKYNVTLRDVKSGDETIHISTQEIGGPSIEQVMSPIWNELGLQFIKKELLETINEIKVAPDEDGAVPNQSPENVQRRVIPNNNAIQHGRPPQTSGPNRQQNITQQFNIPEKIIQHGDVKIKLVGDKVYIEEWVKKIAKDGYKIIGVDGDITDDVTILHKEWVELKEKEEDKKTEPNIMKTEPPTNTSTHDFGKMVDDLIKED